VARRMGVRMAVLRMDSNFIDAGEWKIPGGCMQLESRTGR
jgi:hypothetical protein